MAKIEMKQAAGWLVLGAAAGAAIALIYAPQSGERTRNGIRRLARNSADRLEGLREDIRGRVEVWVDGITQVVKDGIDRGEALGVESCETVLHSFDEAKQCVEDGRSRIQQMIDTRLARG